MIILTVVTARLRTIARKTPTKVAEIATIVAKSTTIVAHLQTVTPNHVGLQARSPVTLLHMSIGCGDQATVQSLNQNELQLDIISFNCLHRRSVLITKPSQENIQWVKNRGIRQKSH